MLRRFLIAICLLAVIGLGVFWVLTRPAPLDADFAAGMWRMRKTARASFTRAAVPPVMQHREVTTS
ncbi:hypothetical protein ACFQFQ_09390 [Sulfitobacter porphyrae]|uniref:Uncharacterized protein n=1 Tax=Sulfitobacter porphyrae TaxID=1246864 RepID=A0ABW2B435_9RHOB